MELLLFTDPASAVRDGVNLLTNLLELMVKICGQEQGESNCSTASIIMALQILGPRKKDRRAFSVAGQADIKALVFGPPSSFSGCTRWSQIVSIFHPLFPRDLINNRMELVLTVILRYFFCSFFFFHF